MFSSRAGEKLDFALNHFKINVESQICADLGCSTGGFTSCLLERGASKVYAVDTGYGVLDYKLRINPQVITMERTNALHVTFPEALDFISIDVSWTPQHLILPHALKLLKPKSKIVSLLKPHYEVKTAVLTPDEALIATENVIADLKLLSIQVVDFVKSPILGGKGGNTEFLIYIQT